MTVGTIRIISTMRFMHDAFTRVRTKRISDQTIDYVPVFVLVAVAVESSVLVIVSMVVYLYVLVPAVSVIRCCPDSMVIPTSSSEITSIVRCFCAAVTS